MAIMTFAVPVWFAMGFTLFIGLILGWVLRDMVSTWVTRKRSLSPDASAKQTKKQHLKSA